MDNQEQIIGWLFLAQSWRKTFSFDDPETASQFGLDLLACRHSPGVYLCILKAQKSPEVKISIFAHSYSTDITAVMSTIESFYQKHHESKKRAVNWPRGEHSP